VGEPTSVDFQRFQSVRARRRSERRRWLSFVAALSVAAVIIGAIQIAGPTLPGWREIVPFLTGASLLREARGRVDAIERDTQTIRIASGLFGMSSVALVVTEATLVVVGEKEGGFGDIQQGEPVVASYETGRRPLHATRVEVVVPSRPQTN
jgi:hypothetical protein